MSKKKAASSPLPWVLFYSALLFATVFYGIGRLCLEAPIAALAFVTIFAILAFFGLMVASRKEGKAE